MGSTKPRCSHDWKRRGIVMNNDPKTWTYSHTICVRCGKIKDVVRTMPIGEPG